MRQMIKNTEDGQMVKTIVAEESDNMEALCDWCNKECAGPDGILKCDGGIIQDYLTCDKCAKDIEGRGDKMEVKFHVGDNKFDVIRNYYKGKGFHAVGKSFSFKHYLKHEMISVG